MECCDEAGRCTGRKDCPIREHTVRRYRAGKAAEMPLPPLPVDVVRPDPAPRPAKADRIPRFPDATLLVSVLLALLIGAWLGYVAGGAG